MRLITILFLTLVFKASAQQPADNCKQVNDIALAERLAHERINPTTNGLLTAASDFDVKYYRCEWEVDPAVRFIKGKVTVYFVVANPATAITLDLMSPLVVDSVKQRNLVLTQQQANNAVQITFLSQLNAGTLDSVSIYYKGVPPNTGFGSFIQDQHAGVPVMWSLSEPYGSRDWWPCKNGLDDKADSIDVIVTAPAQYKAASNGLLQSETLIAGGTKKVTHWKHRYPIASYLICFAVTNYAVFNNSVQLGNITLPMQTYCYPESQASFQGGTQNVLDALQLFHNTFGDYPFIKEKYGHVQFGWGGGMEHQTSTFVVAINESLIAHELGHQWFGDKITTGSWADIWLNEGFASFLASYYAELKYPNSAISNRKAVVDYITSQPGGSVLVDDTTNVGRIFDSRLSYNKGSQLLYMLRWKLGDSAFFRALRSYQKDPELMYGFARTTDLKKHLEAESKQDLTRFFNDWYKGQGYPTYKIEWSQIGSSYVKVKMNQVTSHASVNFFAMPVALKFVNSQYQKTVVLDNTTNGEVFIKNIGFVADTVFIDPDYWLISRNNTAKKITEVTSGQNVVQVFPNPIQNQFSVYLRNFTAPTATVYLYNTLGQLLYFKNLTIVNGSEYVEIQSRHLATGIYYFKIESSDGFRYVKKLLK
ncbi:M1 family aminopeptidase [Ferruginibacter profundus]